MTKQLCTQVEVSRVTTIQQLVDHSNAARSTGSTGANADSSRSHSIMQARTSTVAATIHALQLAHSRRVGTCTPRAYFLIP